MGALDPALGARVATAALFAPLLLAVVGFGPLTLELAMLVIVTASSFELSRLLARVGFRSLPGLFLLAPILGAASLYVPLGVVWTLAALLVSLVAVVWLFHPWIPRRGTSGWVGLLGQVAGAAYCGLLLSYFVRLEAGPWPAASAPGEVGARWAIFAILLIWAGDTGAYLAGTLFGRRQLWPAVSPKKTIEGAWGGVILSSLAAAVLRLWLAPGLSIWEALGLGAAAGLLAMLGDLIESRVKRKAGVKDSGSVLPGHGGLFDRFDSLFLTAPLFHYYLQAFAR